MKEAIQFVSIGVVNRKFNEGVTQVHACDSCWQSFNGFVTMSYPEKTPDVFSVVSNKLLKAIALCSYDPAWKFTDKSLLLSKGSFKARLPISKDYKTTKKIKGKKVKLPATFMETLKALHPFISDDASRDWSQSILFSKGFAYATNNVIAIRTPIDMPDCLLPLELIDILLKVKELPAKMVIGEKNTLFIYSNKAWVQGINIVSDWPDTIDAIFNDTPKIKKIKTNEVEAIKKAIIMTEEDTITINNGKLFTDLCEIDEINIADCSFSTYYISKIIDLFPRIKFTQTRIYFRSKLMEGVMAGKRHA